MDSEGPLMSQAGERQVVQMIGENLLLRWVTAMATTSLCYGILIPIAMTIAYSTAKYQEQTWHSRWQLVTICVGIAAFTAHWILRMGIAITEHQFFQLLDLLRQDIIYDTDTIYAKWNVAQVWLECITPIINDTFIIWRAWMVFEKRRWAAFISVGLCLSTFVFTLFWLSTSPNPNLDMAAILVLAPMLSSDPTSSNSGIFTFQQLITVFLSFITNVFATCFIMWTALSYINFSYEMMDNHQFQSSRIRRILYLLVDAGTVYVILQFVYIMMIITVHPHLISPKYVWTNPADLGQEQKQTIDAELVKDLKSRVQVLEKGRLTSTICAVVETIYLCFSFVYPALTIALIRGPLSAMPETVATSTSCTDD